MERIKSRSGEEVTIFLLLNLMKTMPDILQKMLAIKTLIPSICPEQRYFLLNLESKADSWQSASLLERYYCTHNQVRQAGHSRCSWKQSSSYCKNVKQRVRQRYHIIKHSNFDSFDLRIRREFQSAEQQIFGWSWIIRANDQQSQEADWRRQR